MKPICILNQYAPAAAFEGLKNLGFRTLALSPHPDLAPGEASHADMQFCKISEKSLVCAPGTSPSIIKALQEEKFSVTQGKTWLKPDYPGNIAYNILMAGHVFFHNLPFSDPIAVSMLTKNGICGVPVRQGYAACSAVAVTGPLGEAHIITGDPGLRSAAERQNMETVFVPAQDIVLAGYAHGFVGGCCGVYRNTLYTCGELPEAACRSIVGLGVSVIPVCTGPLTDIGGMLFL